MNFKKIIAFFLSLILCTSLGIKISAQDTVNPSPEIHISSVNFVKSSEICQINIFLYNFDRIAPDGGMYNIRIALPEDLTVQTISKNGTFLSTYNNDYKINSDNILTFSGDFHYDGNEEFAAVTRYTLTAKTSKNAAAGKYDIKLLDSSSVVDDGGNNISISSTDGILRIADREDCIAGDSNADDIVDAADMSLLKKSLLGSSVNIPDPLSADSNADGQTDIRDMIFLKKYFAFSVPVVYLSANGDDRNNGGETAPVRTLNKALDMVTHGGTVKLDGKYTVESDFKWNHHSKSVVLDGGELDITAVSEFMLGDNITFRNISITANKGTTIYTGGYLFILGKNAKFTNEVSLSTDTPESSDGGSDNTPVYDIELEMPTYNPLNEQMGMAIYHFNEGEWDTLLADKFGAKEEEFLTYYRCSDIEGLRNIRKKNGLAWWLISNPFPNRNTTVFRDGWAENIRITAKAFKDAGVWDVLAGFETEEMCMAVTQEQFKTLTGWLRDNFPDKRIFSCLSMYEVRGTAPAGFTIAPMSYDTYGQVTDIGYDWYSHLDEKQYRDAVELMLKNMDRRLNVRVWFFPTSYMFSSAVDETFVTSHLNIMYKLLLEQPNPGGLYLYTWRTWSNAGMADLLDPDLNYNWDNWGKRIVEIGKEMRASDYRYVRTFN